MEGSIITKIKDIKEQKKVLDTEHLNTLARQEQEVLDLIEAHKTAHPEDAEGSGGKLDEMYQELNEIIQERTNLENPGFTEQAAQEIAEGLVVLPAEDVEDEELNSRKKYIESQIAWAEKRGQKDLLTKLKEYLGKLNTRTTLPPSVTEGEKSTETTPRPRHKREISAEKKRTNREEEVVKEITKLIGLSIKPGALAALDHHLDALKRFIEWPGLATRPKLKAQLEERIKAISDILNGRIDTTDNSLGKNATTPETTKESALAALEKEIEKIRQRMEERQKRTEELLSLLAEMEEEEEEEKQGERKETTQVVEGEIMDGGEATKKFLSQKKRKGSLDKVS